MSKTASSTPASVQRRRRLLTGALGAALTLPALRQSFAQPNPVRKIRFGRLTAFPIGALAAHETGIFQRHGIQVELIPLQAGPAAVAATTTGSVDLSFGDLDLTLGMNYTDTKVVENRLGSLFNAQAEAIMETSSPKFKSVFGALLTSGKFSANARATYYSKSTILVSPAVTVPNAPITGNFFPAVVGASTIFDLEFAYDLTEWATLAIGANNLFNKIPEIPGVVSGVAIASGTSPYTNGSTTINSPYNHGPYGTNGGYYYARVSLKF